MKHIPWVKLIIHGFFNTLISYEGAPFEIPLLCIHDPSGHDHYSNHVGVFCAVVLKGSPCLEGIAK